MNTQITIRQVALAINVNPEAFMLMEEMETVLESQNDIYQFMTKGIELNCNRHADRTEVSRILRDMRREKMNEYKLSLIYGDGFFLWITGIFYLQMLIITSKWR